MAASKQAEAVQIGPAGPDSHMSRGASAGRNGHYKMPWPGSTRKPPRGQKTFPWRLDNVDTDLSIPVFLRKDIGDGF